MKPRDYSKELRSEIENMHISIKPISKYTGFTENEIRSYLKKCTQKGVRNKIMSAIDVFLVNRR